VYDSLPSNNKSKMLSLATKTDRTLFFDFLPLDLGKIRGMRTKLQLYTVPGQVYYNSTRQLVLKGADGIVFVADSQDFALDANLESLQNLEDNLKRQGIRIREIPVVMQWNKRDLPNAMGVAELNKEVNKLGGPSFESVATTGIGVEETLRGITQLVLAHLVKKYGLEGSEPLDREISILNPNVPREAPAGNSLWDDDDDVPAAPAPPPPPPARAPAAAAPAVAPPPPPPPAPPPASSAPFVVDDADDDENIPLVRTELVREENPFTDVTDYFHGSDLAATEVPMTSIEIPLPAGILDSLPVLDSQPSRATGSSVAAPPMPPAERRSSDGLVKEISIPLNLTMDELRNHRRLRLKITLDVNLLP
ncbi:MAG: putative GTPase, partial [Acidobacteria bacterium]|nr:putative GTPase [Acidobacteriota bacterium]